MMLRLIGALLIVLGCAGFGIAAARCYRKEERMLSQLLLALEFMECELQYRLSSLPELFTVAADNTKGPIGEILFRFAEELKLQRYSDPKACMDKLLREFTSLPNTIKKLLRQLGNSVGKFDLDGQLKGLRHVKAQCEGLIRIHVKDADVRIRNYQTLGLCAGVALAILLI